MSTGEIEIKTSDWSYQMQAALNLMMYDDYIDAKFNLVPPPGIKQYIVENFHYWSIVYPKTGELTIGTTMSESAFIERVKQYIV